ncbi:PREDICTED: ejaculatory bulb-specific protein 3-like [Papilio polytes]|uniref:Ejaculatory bulb protein III n=1 Tax=Papilio polytes TaxID=76194 RepID=I4DM24_PAPPL|nr:ejaculatory bulb-specific protein 3-like precursor [Papilio polytes]BAM18964.1 ejaculatory bulb protein III [Papilio polytes]
MKVLACFLLLTVLTIAHARTNRKYTSRYDNINLDEILANRRLLMGYLKCLLDQGKCSHDARELKSHIKEALEDNCAQCTDAQKSGMRQVMGHLINHEKEYWTKLTAKYDPERKYVIRYEKELRELSS